MEKYPSQLNLGFRCCGLKVWREKKQFYKTRDKNWGRKIGEDQVKESLLIPFFSKEEGGELRKGIVLAVLKKVVLMRDWFQMQTSFMFFCSSLLIVYDGGMREELLTEKQIECKVKVKLVDFSHTYKNETSEIDENTLHGIESILKFLESLFYE